jgi:ubiquinone/menaquinone biosynthesis C-methylase UbiE
MMHEKRFDGEIERLRAPERVRRLEVERVVSLCLDEAGLDNMLDIGSGSGLFAEAFSRQGLQVSGVDVNPAMLAAAREFVPLGDFREGIAEALPYPDASFDLVFLGLVLHESDEPLKVLQEARRVCRKRVCTLEWPYRDEEFGPPLAHRLAPTQIKELALQAGFDNMESYTLENLVLYCLKA